MHLSGKHFDIVFQLGCATVKLVFAMYTVYNILVAHLLFPKGLTTVSMFDKFQLTFNLKFKVSRNVFQNTNIYQLTCTFFFVWNGTSLYHRKWHLIAFCLENLLKRIAKIDGMSIIFFQSYINSGKFVCYSKLMTFKLIPNNNIASNLASILYIVLNLNGNSTVCKVYLKSYQCQAKTPHN